MQYALRKLLWLLYQNFDVFPPDQKIEICKRVVNQKQFVNLSFHWCWHVRNLVAHIFVYILQGIYKFDMKDEAVTLWLS